MTEQTVETVTKTEEDEGPVYYNPNRVSLVAGIASVLSWFILVGFLADVVTQFLNVNSTVTAQGMTFVSLFKEPAALSFLVTNLVTPSTPAITPANSRGTAKFKKLLAGKPARSFLNQHFKKNICGQSQVALCKAKWRKPLRYWLCATIFYFTTTQSLPLLPKTSGEYISSALAGGTMKVPGVVARAM
jgi:hypothetical protein